MLFFVGLFAGKPQLLAAAKKKAESGASTMRGMFSSRPGQGNKPGQFSRTAPGGRRGKQEEVPIRTKMSAIQKILAKG
jgi:hypothetical protein